MGSTVPALLGLAAFLALWEIIGTYRLAGLTWPPLTDVLAYMADPSRHTLFVRASGASFTSIATGYLIGCLIGIALGMLVRVLRALREGLDRLVALIHATPAIALAPVFMILLDRDRIPVAIAALAVFYLIYIAVTSGMMNAKSAHHDVFSVLGASAANRFMRLELPAALPVIATGLKLAIPVAFIGAIVGEWFGASRGLGLLMISAMQNFQIPLLWSAVLITMVSSLAAFALMGLVERAVHRRFG